MDPILPITFADKVNSAEILAIMEKLQPNTYFTADEINWFKAAINELHERSLANPTFKGDINLSSPVPAMVGVYVPTVSGTYTNYGGIVVDLTAGYTTITFDGVDYAKQIVPIILTNYALNSDLFYKAEKSIGKNLILLENVTAGYYINYANGNLIANALYSATEFIPVVPGNVYTSSIATIGGSIEQMAYYNSSKVYVSGLANTGIKNSITLTIPAGCYFLRLSIRNANSYQFELGSIKTSFELGKIAIKNTTIGFQSIFNENIKKETIDETLINPLSKISVQRLGKNIFNKSNIIPGGYISYTTGNVVVNAGYSYSDYILISPSLAYSLSISSSVLEQFAFYDENKIYISGNSGGVSPINFTSSSNAKYIRLSINNSNLNKNYQLEQNAVATVYEYYNITNKVSELEKYKLTYDHFDPAVVANLGIINVVRLDASGGGDFTTLRAALNSITDAGASKKYEIQIVEGIYDVMASYTDTEINDVGFIGAIIPDYVSLIGLGKKEKTIIKGEIAGTFSSITMNRVSTIAKKGTGDIKNIIITAKNLRYAVHDDYNYANLKRYVKNCDFIHYLGGGFNQAYGEGCWSGSEFIYEDCNFITEMTLMPYSFHNNTGFTKPSSHKFSNCSFICSDGLRAIRFGSMGSGQADTISMYNCKFNGEIQIMEEQSNGVGIDFIINGAGNDVVPYNIVVSNGQQYVYNFSGETIKIKNKGGTTITKGTPVKLVANGFDKIGTSEDISLFYGIAFQDISSNNFGVLKLAGSYIKISDTQLIGLTIGNKIGLSSGVLAVVTGSDYIGVVIDSNYIKLK